MHGRLASADEAVVLSGHDLNLGLKVAQVAVEIGQTPMKLGFQRPHQCAAQPSHAEPHRIGLCRGVSLQRALDRVELEAYAALVVGCEKLGPRSNQEILQAPAQQLVLLTPQANSGVELAKRLVDFRQHRLVVPAPDLDHVLERVEAALPGIEPRANVLEIEIILQGRLEIMRGQELHQVVGLRRLGQLAQANDPVGVLTDLLANEGLEEIALANAVDRRLELVRLGIE